MSKHSREMGAANRLIHGGQVQGEMRPLHNEPPDIVPPDGNLNVNVNINYRQRLIEWRWKASPLALDETRLVLPFFAVKAIAAQLLNVEAQVEQSQPVPMPQPPPPPPRSRVEQ